MTTSPPAHRTVASPDTAAALIGFERSLAAVLRLLVDRATTGDIARRSGHDLPLASWALLEHLAANGPMRVSDIAACHGVDVSSVTPRLQRLERAELVSRSTLPSDARVSLIAITGRGDAALERIHAARRELITREIHHLGAGPITVATHVLDGVAAALSTAALATSPEHDATSTAAGA